MIDVETISQWYRRKKMSNNPFKVYISYARDDTEHNKCAEWLTDELLQNGIEAPIQKYDLIAGDRISITSSDYVLFICTPEYKTKYQDKVEEKEEKNNELFVDDLTIDKRYSKRNSRKFIPVLRRGTESESIPPFLESYKPVILTEEQDQKTRNDNMHYLINVLKENSIKPPVQIANDKTAKTPFPINEREIRGSEENKHKHEGNSISIPRDQTTKNSSRSNERDIHLSGGNKDKYVSEIKEVVSYTCLFCRKQFTKDQIVFSIRPKAQDPAYNDVVFNQQLAKYKHKSYIDENGKEYGLHPISRRMLSQDSEKTKVIKWEINGLPLVVQGPLDNHMQSSENSEIEEKPVKSSERLCPYCHFTLPIGFADEKVYQIGLIGGSRSGKTTYMAVATEYLQEKLGSRASGLNLAQAELLPECKEYQEALYLSQRNPLGAEPDSITGNIIDQMIMPIILHIKPHDKNFRPFFLVFQDIPGEYMKDDNRTYLINSNIPLSDHIILLVDINHFIKTDQQNNCSEFGGYCNQKVSEILNSLEPLGQVMPKNNMLKSFQCMLTKLDLWMDEDQGVKDSIFSKNCDDEHKNAIDSDRLEIVNKQLIEFLKYIGGNNQSGLLDNALQCITYEESEDINYAYTAVASRIVPGHEDQIRRNGADYQSSLNVLEPLMNIFRWENALPIK